MIFLHLYELVQTRVTADGYGLLLQLQHQWFFGAGGAAVLTDVRVVPEEVVKAGAAAKLVDDCVQCDLTRDL